MDSSPNYTKDSSPKYKVLALANIFVFLSIVATVLRCYVRAIMVKSFKLDDWFMVLSLVSVQAWNSESGS